MPNLRSRHRRQKPKPRKRQLKGYELQNIVYRLGMPLAALFASIALRCSALSAACRSTGCSAGSSWPPPGTPRAISLAQEHRVTIIDDILLAKAVRKTFGGDAVVQG